MKETVYETLKSLGIEYEVVNHPPAFTTEEADTYIEGKEGVRSKTMFLSDKKKRNFYLFIMDDTKRLDMKKAGERIGEKGLRFGSPESLKEKLGLEPGSVSPFGLLNNADRDVKVYVDKEILTEKIITFHPNENTATLFLSMDDMFRFYDFIGCSCEIIEL